MSDTMIKTPAQSRVDHQGDATHEGVRVFGNSPEDSIVQIRTNGPVGPYSRKNRPVYSSVHLNLKQIDALIVALETERTRLVSHL